MADTPVNAYSRSVGALLLVTVAAGIFGEMYVPSLMMTGDAATTANQLVVKDEIFRLGFAAYLIEAVCDIVLAWLFYVLLKRVDGDLALLSAFFGLVSMTLFAVTKMFYFAAPHFISGSDYLTTFTPGQQADFASLFLSLYDVLSGLTMLFYGIPWMIRGYLTFKSGYLPRFLGVLMAIAGVGFVAKTFTYVLAPAYSPDLLLAPMFLNSLVVAFWMLVRGVDQDRWSAVAASRYARPEARS